MFCPKCRSEFREGFTLCQACNENLVKELPPDPNAAAAAKTSALEKKRNVFRIEKWLKCGAAVYIIAGVLCDVATLFGAIFLPSPFVKSGSGAGWAAVHVVNFCSAAVGSVLWGAFFYAMGRIIEILKEGFGHEQE